MMDTAISIGLMFVSACFLGFVILITLVVVDKIRGRG